MIAGTIKVNIFINNNFVLLLSGGVSPWGWDKETHKITYFFIFETIPIVI